MANRGKLDSSLITSEVCIRCASCCKWTSSMQYCAPGKGPEWLNVIGAQSENTELMWFEDEVVDHHSLSEGKVVKEERARFKIKFNCPKLVVDEEAGTKMCGIYENRPKVCSNYNCFASANRTQQRPQNWEFIKGIIKEVHGVDVEWDGPLHPTRIPLKNITKFEKV